MHHVTVTVLGDAELQSLNDSVEQLSHARKGLAASCDNFASHLAAAEAEAEGESESTPGVGEQGSKKSEESITLGTFGFPVVVVEPSKDTEQESQELDKKREDSGVQSKTKKVCIAA